VAVVAGHGGWIVEVASWWYFDGQRWLGWGCHNHGNRLAEKIGEGHVVLAQGSSAGGNGVASCVLVPVSADVGGIVGGSGLLVWRGRPGEGSRACCAL